MRLLLPLVALTLLGFDWSHGRPHFKLPRFELFDKDGDGTISEAEIGRAVIKAGLRMADEGLGGISFSAGGGRSYEGEGGIDREEYERIEHTIRVAARSFLHQPSTPGMLQRSLQKLMVMAQNSLDDVEGNMSKLQQFFGSSPASPVFEKVREGIATTLSRFPDNLEVRDRMEALTLLMKDPELEMELEDPYISEVVYTLIRDSSNIRNFQDDQKLMALLQRMNSKYERNQYVSDLLNRIATGKCTFCDEGNQETLQQIFKSSLVFGKVREGIAETLSRYPDNLEVRDRMEALTLLMKDPQLEMELEDPYISEVVYALIRDSTSIRSFQDDSKVMGLLETMKSKYQRNRYVSDLLDRISSGQCTFCDK